MGLGLWDLDGALHPSFHILSACLAMGRECSLLLYIVLRGCLLLSSREYVSIEGTQGSELR